MSKEPGNEIAAAPAVIDLSELDTIVASGRGFELELRHPTSEKPLGQFITILGKDSEQFRAAKRNRVAEPLTMEESEERSVMQLVAATTGFRNILYKGEKLEFSVANARRLYMEQLWIRRQVDKGIADLENFIKD